MNNMTPETTQEKQAHVNLPWKAQRTIDGRNGIHVFHREPHFGDSPWTRIDGADLLASCVVLGLTEEEVRAKAALIVRAVNSHADLVAALERALAVDMPNVKWTRAEIARSRQAWRTQAKEVLAKSRL